MSTQPDPQREYETGASTSEQQGVSDSAAQGDRYAALFESVTGTATLIETQEVAVTERVDEQAGTDRDGSIEAARERGFDDVIDEPESSL